MRNEPRSGHRDDDAVFASLYQDLRRFAAVMGSVDVDPDDLVQEAVARALTHGSRNDLTNPGGYLRTTIVRLVSNRRRGDRRRSQAITALGGAMDMGGLDAYPSDLDELRQLSPVDRSVLYLSIVEQRAHQEIAAILSIREASARKRVSRALSRLRQSVAPTEDSHA